MNKHILMVMKWLKDKDSVSEEELEENKCEAYAASYAACYGADTDYDAYAAAYAAYWADAVEASYWVDKYFKETGEDRNEYEKELEK